MKAKISKSLFIDEFQEDIYRLNSSMRRKVEKRCCTLRTSLNLSIDYSLKDLILSFNFYYILMTVMQMADFKLPKGNI